VKYQAGVKRKSMRAYHAEKRRRAISTREQKNSSKGSVADIAAEKKISQK